MRNYLIQAKVLRNKDELDKIDKQRPGYYKWWAPEEQVEVILKKLALNAAQVLPKLEMKADLYCIYVGIAVKESVKLRLDWHINQKHTYSQVKNGTLSTLRRTISSIVGEDMLDKNATNQFIDSLHIEYFLLDNEIKSNEASLALHSIERKLLSSETLYLLNIQENKHPQAPIKKLRELRKLSKQKALNNK